MNELKIFENKAFGEVRAVDLDGKSWFVAKDVCEILALKNTTHALLSLDVDEKTELSGSKVGNNISKLRAVSESGLYSLIFNSIKPEAKRFRKWVTGEVLPSLRKHEQYTIRQESMEDDELLSKALLAAQRIIQEKDRKLQEAIKNG